MQVTPAIRCIHPLDAYAGCCCVPANNQSLSLQGIDPWPCFSGRLPSAASPSSVNQHIDCHRFQDTLPATYAYTVCTCRSVIENGPIVAPADVMDARAMSLLVHDSCLTDIGNHNISSPSAEAAYCKSLLPSYPIMPLWPRFPESTPAPPPRPPISRYVHIRPRPAQSTPGATTLPTPEAPTPRSAPTPRRTLTDEERRRICQYHEDHKEAKQTDIGDRFGVERSTVSKVLRQKEKYLSMEYRTRSPIKKNKGKAPDVGKALINSARNRQRRGIPFTDAMIEEEASRFALVSGEVLTPDQLQHYKQIINKNKRN